MSIKAVFIDIDNTLLDFDEYVKETMRVGFEHFKLKPYEDYMYDIFTKENNKLWHDLEKGLTTFSEIKERRFNIIFKALGIEFDGPTFEHYFRDRIYDNAIVIKGAKELLEELHRKYIVCVASNGPFEQQVHRIAVGKLDEFVDYYCISEKYHCSKPSKDFFDMAFNEMNENRKEVIKPEEVLMIGDSLTSDIRGGKNYGMPTIYFNKHKKENTTEIQADYSFDTLDDINNFIKKNY